MPKQFETGHAINVANLETLISFCVGYGAQYNPSKRTITISALTDLLNTCRTAVQNVTDNLTLYNNAINTRQTIFAGLKTLSTRIINALQATDALSQTIEDAKGFNKKIQGTKTKKIENAAATNPDTKSVSTSQQSYNQQIEHFRGLISLLISEPNYAPNEPELQIPTLSILLNEKQNANTNIINAFTNISNARITRNETLYNPETGLLNTVQEVKKYVKSVFGATSAQYKQISSLKFTSK